MSDSAVGMGATVISALGSAAWVPAAFGYDLMSVAGETGGVMLATLLGIVGVLTIGMKFDLIDA